MKNIANVTTDLHRLFLVSFTSGDFELTMLVMMAFMEHNGIRFNPEYSEETFFDELNSAHYDSPIHFEQLCMKCLDFDAIQRSENERIHYRPTQPVSETIDHLPFPTETELAEVFEIIANNHKSAA